MVATWGTLSWRGTASGRQPHRAVHPIGQHRNARRDVERLVGRVHERRRLADHQPEDSLPAVARRPDGQGRRSGADVGDGRLPAAQSAAAGPLGHRASARHRVPEAVLPPANRSSPASTIRPRRSASWPRPPRSRAARNALGRRAYQKGLETLQWRADDENDDELVYDVLYRREGESSWKPLRRGVAGHDSRLGHEYGAERFVLRQGRRVRRTVESGRHRADRRARELGVRRRQHPAGHRRRRASASIAAGRS